MEEDLHSTWKVTQSTDHYQIVTNSRNLLGQQYLVPLPFPTSTSLQDQIDIYRMRKRQNEFLVKILDVQTQSQKLGHLQSQTLKIVTERIPYRLSQIHQLTQNEAIFILYRCLRGFKVICQMLGPVVVEDSMIGIDSKGLVKVWINENYSRNYPEAGNKIGVVKDKAIQKMVVSIIQSVKENNLPEELIVKLKKILATSLEEHIGVVEKYLKEKRIDLGWIRVKVNKEEGEMAVEGAGKNDGGDNFKVEGRQGYGGNQQLLAPPIQVSPVARVRPMSPFANNIPHSHIQNPRGLSPMPQQQAFNGMVRPSSARPGEQRIHHQQQQQQQFLQFPQQQQLLVPGQFGNPRGLSPRPRSPRPLSPNPQFINQIPSHLFMPQQQQQIPISKRPLHQPQPQPQHRPQPQQPQRKPQPVSINTKEQVQIDSKSKQSKNTKKSSYMAESECFPLGQMPAQYSPIKPNMPGRHYQQMIFQQLNTGNPFAQMFGQQLMSPQMFSPPDYYQQQPRQQQQYLGPPSNIGMMPPPLSHLNSPIQQAHNEHQYIHSQIMQNLQNHLGGQGNGQGQQGGYVPTFKRM